MTEFVQFNLVWFSFVSTVCRLKSNKNLTDLLKKLYLLFSNLIGKLHSFGFSICFLYPTTVFVLLSWKFIKCIRYVTFSATFWTFITLRIRFLARHKGFVEKHSSHYCLVLI